MYDLLGLGYIRLGPSIAQPPAPFIGTTASVVVTGGIGGESLSAPATPLRIGEPPGDVPPQADSSFRMPDYVEVRW